MNDRSYLDAKISSLEGQINDLKTELKELRKESKEILEFVHQTKGGRRYLAFVITLAAGLGAIITYVAEYVKAL